MSATNIVTLAVALIAAGSGIISALLSRHNRHELQELRISVDGRLTALIASLEAEATSAAALARLQGHAQGIADEQARK